MRLVRYNTYPGYRFNDFSNCNYEEATPQYKVIKEDEAYKVIMSVPGYQKDDFEIKVEKDQLLITASWNEEPEAKNLKTDFRKPFEKRFKLSEKLNAENISASYNNGLLEINVPLKEEEAVVSRQIEIA